MLRRALAVAVVAASFSLALVAPASATSLDRTGWTATASSEGFGYPVGHLFDGNSSTLWSTGSGQTPGQWLRVDLGATTSFETIDLAVGTAPNDYARAYSVTLSTDGTTWSTPRTGAGSVVDGSMRIAFEALVSARYIRIEQTSGHFINAWSVAEFTLLIDDYSWMTPTVYATESVVVPNEGFDLVGQGFAAAEAVTISQGATTWTVTTDSEGAFTRTVSLGSAVTRGDVEFVVEGALTEKPQVVEVLLHDIGVDTDAWVSACPSVAPARFDDVTDDSSPFYAAIQWMYASGISLGTAQVEGRPLYKPVDSVSRQAMAAFLYRLSGDSFTAPAQPSFADVTTASPFYTAIEWMSARGISLGTAQPVGPALFKPAGPVSRQAMAQFLARYSGAALTAPTEQSFADVPIDSSPSAAIAWMKDTAISTGTVQPSGLPLYKPAEPVSRQAMAAFLYRLEH